MEIDFKKSFVSIYDEVKGFSRIFKFTLFLTITEISLFVISPEDSNEAFPALNGSRFLWTPVIPLITSICIGVWCLLSLQGRLSGLEIKIASFGTPFLIFISLQFATSSPVGVDGWFFLSSSQYYSQFGEAGAANYMSHPLVMMPVDMWIRTFGGSGRNMASILGLLMGMYWIYLVVNALHYSPNFRKTGVLIILGLSLFFLITGWFPLRYSAHLLALLIGHHLIHKKSGDFVTLGDVMLCIALGISHAFSPIVFGTIFFIESMIRTETSKRSRNLGIIISLVFISWNSDLAIRTLSFYQIGEDTEVWIILLPFYAVSLCVYLFSMFYERKYGKREGQIIGGGFGTSNLAIVIGCVICIPIILIADTQTGAARFTHRLVTYSVVPFCWSGGWVLNQIFEKFQGLVDEREISKEIDVIVVSIVSVMAALGAGILQTSFISNTEVMPEGAVKCWDMVEDSGGLGVLVGEFDGRAILISDQLHPPLVHKYFTFVKQGDGDRIRLIDPVKIVGVLETPDLFEKISQETDVSFEDWYLAGEISGACRLWINPEHVQFLDKGVTWEKLDTSWY